MKIELYGELTSMNIGILNMRKNVLLLNNFMLALVCTVFSTTALSSSGDVQGTINTLRYHSNELSSESWKMASWVKLNGVTAAGTCLTRSGDDFDGKNGLVAFKIESDDKVAMSILLSAQAQGKTLALHWDDSLKDSGYCKALYITITN